MSTRASLGAGEVGHWVMGQSVCGEGTWLGSGSSLYRGRGTVGQLDSPCTRRLKMLENVYRAHQALLL